MIRILIGVALFGLSTDNHYYYSERYVNNQLLVLETINKDFIRTFDYHLNRS